MKQVKPEIESFARIRVIGAGGSGSNAVNHMINCKVKGVDFIVVNTDAQDLHHSPAKHKIHIGRDLTRGLGSGMNSEIGKHAAEEQLEEIQDALKGSDMVFVTCGLGGGTGTGSAPVIARAARESGALTIAVVTLPFSFEGNARRQVAEDGLAELRKVVDSVIIVPNDKILETVEKNTGLKDAFALCDDVLRNAVEGISELITKDGGINVDFADIKAVMEATGSLLLGIGEASGEGRAAEAALKAINSPLLDVSIDGATGILFVIAGKDDLGIHELQEAADAITKSVDPNAKIIFGTLYDDTLKKGAVKVTVIATGFGNSIDSLPKKTSLFGKAAPVEEPKEIHNTMPSPTTEATERTTEEPKKKSVQNIKAKPTHEHKKTMPKRVSVQKKKVDDDDDFSMIPSFLRRSKLR